MFFISTVSNPVPMLLTNPITNAIKLFPRDNRTQPSVPNAPYSFDEMPERNQAAIIRRRALEGRPIDALALFRDLAHNQQCHEPSALPLSTALACCASLGAVRAGRELHGFMFRSIRNHNGDACCAESSLVRFYESCGLLSRAREVFDRMPQRDVVSWTIMVMAYADRKGHERQAMELLHEMLSSNVMPNCHTITVVLQCANLEEAKELHALAAKHSWGTDAFVGGALVATYAKSGILDAARLVFDRIENKDVACYNILISSYSESGLAERFISVFDEMRLFGFAMNKATCIALLNGCANFGCLTLSKQLHAQTIVHGFSSEELRQGVIVDMYWKCGDLQTAHAAFDRISNKNNVVEWNSIICGYGKHGNTAEALKMFSLMESASVPPDHITFTCLLNACSHAGLISDAFKLFTKMSQEYEIHAQNEHYCCMVDLMGRAGLVREAYELICSSSEYESKWGPSVWSALLSACKLHDDAEIGELAARTLFELEPHSSAAYVTLAAIFAAKRRWNDVAKVREMMDARGVKKVAGFSSINIDGITRKFRAGKDVKGDGAEEIECVCRSLHLSMSDHECLEMLVDWGDECG